MALINCPECGKEISDEAKSCPNCGKPLKVKREIKINKKKLGIVIGIIVVLTIGIIVGLRIYTNNPDYVIKKYVEAINNGKFDELEKYEYNYEDYTIKSDAKDYNPAKAKITSYDSPDKIPEDISYLCINQYIPPVQEYKNIKETKVYYIKNELLGLYKNYIVVGKVRGKWMIVYSPYYYLE